MTPPREAEVRGLYRKGMGERGEPQNFFPDPPAPLGVSGTADSKALVGARLWICTF